MSELSHHQECADCGSSDALAVYKDGSAYCFSFGCEKHHPIGTFEGNSDEQSVSVPSSAPREGGPAFVTEVQFKSLPARNISLTTAERYGYGFGERYSSPCHVAPFFNAKTGKLVGQKLRKPGKKFEVIGSVSSALFGQQIARNGGRMLVITEGEIDAMSVSEAMSLDFPAVSVPNGAAGAKKSIAANMQWLMKFDSVVLCFDQDDAGQAAAAECAALIEPGHVLIAKLPLKDASAMLVEGRTEELRNAMWEAREWRPDGIVAIADFMDEAMRPVEMGLPWWSERLTNLTYGRRYGEVYGFGAGTGAGKTDWFTQQMVYDMTELDERVGIIYLEMPKREVAQRLAGKMVGKRFHVPDDGWKIEQLREALEEIKDKAVLYDHFGETDWEIIKAQIRFMNASMGIRHFYLDHLTAMADPRHERESLELLMKEMAMLAQEREIIIHYISHLATPQGTPHEEGGQISGKHFKGSRAIQYWSHFLFGIERNQQADSEDERRISWLRVIKDRYTGTATGFRLPMVYHPDTGLLYEADEALFENKSGDF